MTRLAATFLMVIFVVVFLVPVTETDAKERPEITRHEVRLLEGAASVTVQWQSPNPVLRVLVIVGKAQKEIKVDEYDNKRNRDGYWGEASLKLSVSYSTSTSSAPSQPYNPYQAYGQYPPYGAQQPSATNPDSVPYEIVVEDDLRQRSEPVSGSVRTAQGTARDTVDDGWGREHVQLQAPTSGTPPPFPPPPPPGQTVGGMVDQVIGFVQGNPPQGQQGGRLPSGAGSASISLELKNDRFTPGAGVVPLGGTAPGDEVAVVLGPTNRPFRVAKVNFICGGSTGTGTFTLKIHQETGRPEPGTLLFSETYGVQSSDQQFQEIDLSTRNISLPAGAVRVSIAYQQAGLPGIAFDGAGNSVPGKNWVFRSGAWTDAANVGARGNAIIRATIITQ
jgi:hypothetical protein